MIVANFLNLFHIGEYHPQQDSPPKFRSFLTKVSVQQITFGHVRLHPFTPLQL